MSAQGVGQASPGSAAMIADNFSGGVHLVLLFLLIEDTLLASFVGLSDQGVAVENGQIGFGLLTQRCGILGADACRDFGGASRACLFALVGFPNSGL